MGHSDPSSHKNIFEIFEKKKQNHFLSEISRLTLL